MPDARALRYVTRPASAPLISAMSNRIYRFPRDSMKIKRMIYRFRYTRVLHSVDDQRPKKLTFKVNEQHRFQMTIVIWIMFVKVTVLCNFCDLKRSRSNEFRERSSFMVQFFVSVMLIKAMLPC